MQMLETKCRADSFHEDPKMLCQWLQELEKKLNSAPSLTEATKFSYEELKRKLAEHTVSIHFINYLYIVMVN